MRENLFYMSAQIGRKILFHMREWVSARAFVHFSHHARCAALNWLNGRIDFSAKSSTRNPQRSVLSPNKGQRRILIVGNRAAADFSAHEGHCVDQERDACSFFQNVIIYRISRALSIYTSCHVLLHLFFSFNEHFHPQRERAQSKERCISKADAAALPEEG